jgi:hypothetical protein
MKNFTDQDVVKSDLDRILANCKELIEAPPEWMKRGLQETASGYGSKLNSGFKISFNGKIYRIYTTIWSNCGTNWFVSKGRKIIVSLC